jgi:hypothetical protein
MEEYLLCKCEALNSNPESHQKNKTKPQAHQQLACTLVRPEKSTQAITRLLIQRNCEITMCCFKLLNL